MEFCQKRPIEVKGAAGTMCVHALFDCNEPKYLSSDTPVKVGDELYWDGLCAVITDLVRWPGRIELQFRINQT